MAPCSPTNGTHEFDMERLRASGAAAEVEYRDEIASTQDLARELAARPRLPLPALVVARTQTAGRGRGNNRWWSGPGGLAFSLVLPPLPLADGPPPLVSWAAASAVCRAVRSRAAGQSCGIKWPNDVYLAGKKVCGVLVESLVPPGVSARRWIVGAGVNVNRSLSQAPPEIAARGIALCDATGRTHDLTDLLLGILENLREELASLARRDPAQIERWRADSLLTGRRVSLQIGPRTIHGECQGLADDGVLLVETAAGLQRIASGTVVGVQPPLGP